MVEDNRKSLMNIRFLYKKMITTRKLLCQIVIASISMGLITPCQAIEEVEEVPESSAEEEASLNNLLQMGQQLWEEFAPEEIQEEYEFPTLENIEQFLVELEVDFVNGTPEQLALYSSQADLALSTLRQYEGGDALADWLEPRLDFLTAASQMEEAETVTEDEKTEKALEVPESAPGPPQFTHQYWVDIMSKRALPKRARKYVPIFKKAFDEEGVPTELIWMSEVESSMNPRAKSPVGARGPFQFMPATAKRFGLRTSFPDERTHPAKSAKAAASYLRILYNRFDSWQLALAAYNAGEGRVSRALTAAKATTFEAVADTLPTETRMYVPKVLATVAVRESIDPSQLPGPKEVKTSSIAESSSSVIVAENLLIDLER
jgi:membrane-bound lytic murein transglycosylase D